MEIKKNKRECPKCKEEIIYTGKYAIYSKNVAEKRKTLCRSCFSKGEKNGFYGKSHSNKNKQMFAKNAKLLHTGRKRTEETKNRISIGIRNSNHSEIMKSESIKSKLRKSNSTASKKMWKDPIYRKKIIESRIGHFVSDETKQKIRMKRILYLKSKPFCLQSKSATKFLDGLEKKWNVKIEREFELSGRFFDGRIKNLLIEVDSSWWHNNEKQIIIDQLKERIAKSNGYVIKRFRINNIKSVQVVLDSTGDVI